MPSPNHPICWAKCLACQCFVCTPLLHTLVHPCPCQSRAHVNQHSNAEDRRKSDQNRCPSSLCALSDTGQSTTKYKRRMRTRHHQNCCHPCFGLIQASARGDTQVRSATKSPHAITERCEYKDFNVWISLAAVLHNVLQTHTRHGHMTYVTFEDAC